jgi:hypothetical protein
MSRISFVWPLKTGFGIVLEYKEQFVLDVLWFDVVLVPFVDQVACLLGDLVENVVHVLSAQNRRHPLTNDTCSGVP